MLIVKIQNDGTGTVDIGNYRYQVMVNETVIESGDIKGHFRRKGWRHLLLDLVRNSNYWNLVETMQILEHEQKPEEE